MVAAVLLTVVTIFQGVYIGQIIDQQEHLTKRFRISEEECLVGEWEVEQLSPKGSRRIKEIDFGLLGLVRIIEMKQGYSTSSIYYADRAGGRFLLENICEGYTHEFKIDERDAECQEMKGRLILQPFDEREQKVIKLKLSRPSRINLTHLQAESTAAEEM